ncbi:hypothetical protein B0H19DRAFT_1057783 [Mycena capillaripes]|nr:hypothetical protein B0H19DRAFT_1057783 [Mycena capillaripes]
MAIAPGTKESYIGKFFGRRLLRHKNGHPIIQTTIVSTYHNGYYDECLLVLLNCVCRCVQPSGTWLIYSITKFDPNTPVFGAIIKSINVFIYLTLFTNLVSGSSGRSDGVTSKIVSVIVESVSLATLSSTVDFEPVLTLSQTHATIFSYIIIRVSRGSSYGDSSGNVANTSLNRERANSQTFELSQTRNNRSGIRSEMQVRLERDTVQQNDLESAKDSESNIGNANSTPLYLCYLNSALPVI